MRSGGEGEIRTPVTRKGKPAFEAGAIDHSATSPRGLSLHYTNRTALVGQAIGVVACRAFLKRLGLARGRLVTNTTSVRTSALNFDAANYRVSGNAEANRRFRREHRKPFVRPEKA